jgi:glycosyltransferase involved in cell wall biosynthesis
MYPLDTVRLLDWESQEGRHSGGVVLDEVQRVVQGRIDIELQRLHHMVSIVVPVLNEARTLEEVLKSLIGLDFLPLGLTKEVIVVDGGSNDESQRIAKALSPVRTFALARNEGRGAALRLGIEKARGNIIVFFAADREYNITDLQTIVQTLVGSRYRAVFGTRAIKVRDLSEQLSGIYANHRWLYLSSKYGGILLSVLTLLLYNRYVSDVLTSVKGFDAQLLKDLKLESNGRDLETEIIAKLGRRHEFIMEVPVDYTPRTRSEGKKITVQDGLRAMLQLVRCRFRKDRVGGAPQ